MLNYISFYVSFVCFVHILTLPGFSDARYKEESSRTVGLWVFFGHAFSSDFQHVQQIVKTHSNPQPTYNPPKKKTGGKASKLSGRVSRWIQRREAESREKNEEKTSR